MNSKSLCAITFSIFLIFGLLAGVIPARASEESSSISLAVMWSGEKHRVNQAVPGPFGKLTPASSSLYVITSVTLTWSPSSGAAGYEICVDSVNNNACDTNWVYSPVNPYVSVDGLVTGKVYFWQVRAKSVSGDTYADNGAWWQFTTVPTFVDVPYNYWAWDFIEQLYRGGLTIGCFPVPLRYCPNAMNTRAEMALFLAHAKWGPTYIPPTGTGNIFGDIPLTYWAVNHIELLYWYGITKGCWQSPLFYCPETPVTRAEMAAFLLRTKYGSAHVPQPPVGIFSDVPVSHWAAGWIEELYGEGITGGCSAAPLKYCPENYVTHDEMAKFLVLTFTLP